MIFFVYEVEPHAPVFEKGGRQYYRTGDTWVAVKHANGQTMPHVFCLPEFLPADNVALDVLSMAVVAIESIPSCRALPLHALRQCFAIMPGHCLPAPEQ